MFPFNRCLAGFKKIIIGFGEMLTTEEAGIGGVGGWGRSFEDKVLAGIYQTFFFLSEFAPEKKNNVFSFVGKGFDGGVGEFFPAKIAMRSGLAGADGQNGIKQ